jgi:exonuclease SbcC
VAGLPRIRAELGRLQDQLKKKQDALDEAEEKRSAGELNVNRVEQRLSEMIAKRAVAQTRAALLEWVRTTKPGYAQMLAGQQDVSEQRKRAMEALTQDRVSEANAVSDVRNHESLTAQATEKLASKRAELLAVQTLNESTGTWDANRARLASVVEEERISQSSLESLRTEERELAPQVGALAAQEERLSSHIAEVDKSQSELKRLLSQLQGHVSSGICPLCGEDHGSKEELVRRIQQRSVADPASGARRELIELQEKAEHLAERVANNKQKRRTVEAHLTSLKQEREGLNSATTNFVDQAAKLGIAAEPAGRTPAEQIQIQMDSLQEDVADLTRQALDLESELQSARTALAKVREVVTAREAEVADKEAALAHLQEETNRLRKDPRLTQVSLDIDAGPLAELERLNLLDLNSFNAEAAKAESDAAQHRAEVGARQQESASLKAELPALRTQLNSLQRTVTQITGRLEESKLSPDASEESLLTLIAAESRAQTQFHALRDTAASIELAIDAATTAAALTRLLQNVRNKERALAAAGRKRDQHGPWLKYFDVLVRLVSSQQSDAIATFAHDYGPRTSVIQRRLRSVYGFDEIEIQSHESTISVRVKRRGEELRPTDYFSQSQQQTLLLGLFLTAYLSQTWSALSPVFLDDPVTHFDDLNTYAFLDLIVGLLESNFGQRQFVISTCDEKLLLLARQKFRHLGNRAKFYRFSAISADGPVIDEIALQ